MAGTKYTIQGRGVPIILWCRVSLSLSVSQERDICTSVVCTMCMVQCECVGACMCVRAGLCVCIHAYVLVSRMVQMAVICHGDERERRGSDIGSGGGSPLSCIAVLGVGFRLGFSVWGFRKHTVYSTYYLRCGNSHGSPGLLARWNSTQCKTLFLEL